MQSLLMDIQKYIIEYAKMITAVFELPVDIADCNKIRIAGTLNPNYHLGWPLYSGRMYERVMASGEVFFLESSYNEPICKDCERLDVCGDMCRLYWPIKLDDEVLGAICLSSSNAEEKRGMIENLEKYQLFMQSVVDLISLKASEFRNEKRQRYHAALYDQLINLIQDGVMILDSHKVPLYLNEQCRHSLNCNLMQIQYLRKIKQFSIMTRHPENTNRAEYIVRIQDRRIRLLGVEHSITDIESGEKNIVFIFTDMTQMNQSSIANTALEQIGFESLIGKSPPFYQLIMECKEAAMKSNSTLFFGERGTGKEMFALAMHNESMRRNGRFIRIVAQGSAQDELLQKVVFSIDYNSTGNVSNYEFLSGNTLFIDEVSTLSFANQDALKHLIIDSAYNNFKVICSTSIDLGDLVSRGTFVQELFYLLEKNIIKVPPIRLRGKDLLLFINHFLVQQNAAKNKHITLSKEVYKTMGEYSWFGNVREIENVISYIVENSEQDSSEITLANLPELVTQKFNDDKKTSYNLKEVEKAAIINALNTFSGSSNSRSRIAQELGISRATLYRKMKEYNIKEESLFK